MNIILTKKAFENYLNLKDKLHAFTTDEFNNIIKPDVFLLRQYPNNVKFNLQQFWCIVKESNNKTINNGFKMKWDSLGNSNNEIRLLVAIINDNAYLCRAYLKKDYEHLQYKNLKFDIERIMENPNNPIYNIARL